MPNASELMRMEIEAQPLQSETEHRRPMTGYEQMDDERLILKIFNGQCVAGNFQLRRELEYRLRERGNG
jgi:hypothetical protein